MSVINAIEKKYMKPHVVDVKSGDSVKVHQKIREGNKERVQVFEGLVIKTARQGSHTSSITVRRVASGVGVEKTYLIHSPLVTKVEVVKRSKVRRNYLSYMRQRTGKSARLTGVDFDQEEVNKVPEPVQPEEKPKTEAEKKPEQEKPEAKSEAKEQTPKEKVSPDKTEKDSKAEAADTSPKEKNEEKTS
jgi:large subunit ribosomal protein L19